MATTKTTRKTSKKSAVATRWTNRKLRNLLAKFAETFNYVWYPNGKTVGYEDENMPPCTVSDNYGGNPAFVIGITKNGRGAGLIAADDHREKFVRIRPENVERAIREHKGWFFDGRW